MSWLITPQLKSVDGIPWDQIPAGLRWTPAQITTALWLDAADTATVTTVSGAVSQWNDKSGNDINATQSNSSIRPVLSVGGLNGKNVISFTGGASSQYLNTALNSWQSAFIVYSNTRTEANITALGSLYNTSGDIGTRGGAYHGFSDASRLFSQSFTRSETLNGSNFADGTSIGDGSSTPRPSAPTIFSHVATSAFTASNGLRVIGSDGALALSRGITGIIAEIILLPTAASTSIRQIFEGYLAHKWGLASKLPSDHPHKNTAPTI